jgi:hypothetical protein
MVLDSTMKNSLPLRWMATLCTGLALQYFVSLSDAQSEPPTDLTLPVGGADFQGWKGFQTTGSAVAKLLLPGKASFEYPHGPRGWYSFGFRAMNDSTQDWSDYYGLCLELQVPVGSSVNLDAVIKTFAGDEKSQYRPESKASLCLVGEKEWQRVVLPWASFDYKKGQPAFLHFIQQLQIEINPVGGKQAPASVGIRSIKLVKADSISLESAIQGKAVEAGGVASYEVRVGNCTESPKQVRLDFEHYGWDVMTASVAPRELTLAPGATALCKVSVSVPNEGVPPGGHETQKLIALSAGAGNPISRLDLVTARDVPRPSILHTVQGWDEVREKVKNYDWAKKSQEENYVKLAETWQVPEAATPEGRAHGPEGHPYIFPNPDFVNLSKTAIAWQLTRNKAYAEKVALFLRRLADEKTGYASTLAATNMGEPQEGENFQSVAIAYDAILDAGVLSDLDRASIEKMFRLYMQTVNLTLGIGNVGNWSTAANTGGLFAALALGDLAAAERYISGPSGFNDYVTKGIMDDGWWWECSTSYNFWVAAELTQSALACKPWGIDLLAQELPANFSPDTIITPWGLNPPYGISFQKWGPNHRNTRSVKQLWDAVPKATDYRGVIFGMNDGHEEEVGGSRLDLAYYAFRDPLYAICIKRSGKRDLIYGVPELPETSATPYLDSSYAENIGYALLRSQTEKREPRDQIEAVFKIGTQGGFHGHFDRVSLDAIMRYGHSFWNPESIWWGYGNFMYKFFVQTSVNHNMVVVDQKMQEAVPSTQLLFHSGKMMQAVVQQSDAHWSDPPYGGMKYDASSSGGAVKGLPAQMRKNQQSFPLVADRKQGELGPYSDRVLQRRLGVVTDDYILVADYLKSSEEHTFDNLFQMKGFLSLEGVGKKTLRHEAQFNPDPRSAGQFITDCDWYQIAAPALAKFEIKYGNGIDDHTTHADHNEAGVLKLDLHALWPKEQEIMLANAPENLGTSQWVSYEVTADQKSLAKGETGAWVIGAVDIDVPVTGNKELVLSITSKGSKRALFWANARLVTADGTELPIAGAGSNENVLPISKTGEDYYGGPITIAGNPAPDAIPTQPSDVNKPAVIHIPLAGKNAVRFKATLGADYPVGNESQSRKVFATRSKGNSARFLTLIEPYEAKAMVSSAVATGPDSLHVELGDGRVQEIVIHNLEGSGTDISLEIKESKNGVLLRQETTGGKP